MHNPKWKKQKNKVFKKNVIGVKETSDVASIYEWMYK